MNAAADRLKFCTNCAAHFDEVYEHNTIGPCCPICLHAMPTGRRSSSHTPKTKKSTPQGVRRRDRRIRQLKERDGDRCWICQRRLHDDITFDHVVPIVLGGTDALANLRLAHEGCNSERGHDEPPIQRQDSLADQMRDVMMYATQMGCWDAVDWIRRRFDREEEP